MSTLTLSPAPQRAHFSPAPGAGRRGRGKAAGRGSDVAFAAFAVYGALRWGELLAPAPAGRLLALAILAAGLAAGARRLRGRGRWLLVPLAGAALAAVLAISGWPLQLITHLRLSVLTRAIGTGLTDLPRALVPYGGPEANLRRVITAGAGGLLLVAALLPPLLPRRCGLAARLPAAVALLTLAVVPATLLHPRRPDLEGLLLLGLLAGYLWAGRLGERAAPGAAVLLALAGLAAVPLAGWLRQPTAWINPEGLGGGAPVHTLAQFDWQQDYGPLRWPRNGLEVLEVQATRPEYWKAENLDAFDGRGWSPSSAPLATEPATVPAARLRRWTQTLTIIVGALASHEVLGAGTAAHPSHLPGVTPGTSPGTWTLPRGLSPGESYRVAVYDPAPSSAALARISAEPANALAGERTIALPESSVAAPPAPPATPANQVTFPAFGSGDRAAGGRPGQSRGALAHSAYAPVYALARRLRARAGTPYAYLSSILSLLGHGYRYDETPPTSSLPLVSFLLRTRAGYCQHFAGAMALLLRMGGVPARVSTGFTSGQKDASTAEWLVDDYDAHAWVEAWFPGWGWVTFDPTPGAAPERHHSAPLGSAFTGSAAYRQHQPSAGTHGLGGRLARSTPGSPAARRGHAGGPFGGAGAVVAIVLLALVLLLLAAVLRATVRLHPPSQRELVDELERAHRRVGRPLAAGTTLAVLEARLRDAPEAAGYVRRLRELRYAEPGTLPQRPTRRQRRALRRRLRGVAGHGGRLRGLWALPPLWVLLH